MKELLDFCLECLAVTGMVAIGIVILCAFGVLAYVVVEGCSGGATWREKR